MYNSRHGGGPRHGGHGGSAHPSTRQGTHSFPRPNRCIHLPGFEHDHVRLHASCIGRMREFGISGPRELEQILLGRVPCVAGEEARQQIVRRLSYFAHLGWISQEVYSSLRRGHEGQGGRRWQGREMHGGGGRYSGHGGNHGRGGLVMVGGPSRHGGMGEGYRNDDPDGSFDEDDFDDDEDEDDDIYEDEDYARFARNTNAAMEYAQGPGRNRDPELAETLDLIDRMPVRPDPRRGQRPGGW